MRAKTSNAGQHALAWWSLLENPCFRRSSRSVLTLPGSLLKVCLISCMAFWKSSGVPYVGSLSFVDASWLPRPRETSGDGRLDAEPMA